MKKRFGFAVMALALAGGAAVWAEEEKKDYVHSAAAQDYIHGAPEYPSEPWLLAAGGRIYDDWASALDRDEVKSTNPAYPVATNAEQTGYGTWRCKECHGWDYLGKEGIYSKGGHFTGIPGINGAIGKPVDQIALTLRDANHPYTVEMISDEEMQRVAAFVSRGQVDMRSFLDMETRTVNKGDVNHGREIFQTTCAACHGFDGRAMDWGSDGNHNYVGTEAVEVPDEVMNKILNAHTGVQMINLRAFPFENAVDLIAYAATLPLDPPKE
ncbi:MAG: c-type cytochrome [Paracoccaceae bacterium]